MTDIDPKRLKAVLQAIDPYKMAPPSTELYVYGVPIVRKVLEADDQWRANHQVMLDSSTGITPAANPTSGGKVEQDAAGEEPALPEGVTYEDGFYFITKYGFAGRIGMCQWQEADLRAVADHMRAHYDRQRLQDKREACTHRYVKAVICDGKGEAICATCGTELNDIKVEVQP